MDRRFDEVDRRFETVDRRFDEVDRRFEAVDRRFDEVDKRLDGMDQRLGRVENGLVTLRNDVAPLKGAHARNAALEEARLISEEMGFALVRALTLDDIADIVQFQDTTDIPTGDLRSFRRADLILEVADGGGAGHYVAVEVSYTANGRDTARAIRNASFLTRFTGKRSHAAVASLRVDERIRDAIDSGEVSWYQLDARRLEAE